MKQFELIVKHFTGKKRETQKVSTLFKTLCIQHSATVHMPFN